MNEICKGFFSVMERSVTFKPVPLPLACRSENSETTESYGLS